ncbi:hypothetical protein DM01DRAFT_1336737 [Hesseltinella vesiculosa]|uniref:Uncharacterized protein n=1 Tax=Hesseltinella vesiculosa TaxID=101127 RepID=A0A1X2GF51_9FUNG|nr:hypothetical protein DM01DRAFT_1336737 [Hesseltinella vesiculosa]
MSPSQRSFPPALSLSVSSSCASSLRSPSPIEAQYQVDWSSSSPQDVGSSPHNEKYPQQPSRDPKVACDDVAPIAFSSRDSGTPFLTSCHLPPPKTPAGTPWLSPCHQRWGDSELAMELADLPVHQPSLKRKLLHWLCKPRVIQQKKYLPWLAASK